MDGSTMAAWVGVAVLSVSSIGSWVVYYWRGARKNGLWMGRIETKVDTLAASSNGTGHKVDALSERTAALEAKVDGLSSRLGSVERQLTKSNRSRST